MTTSKQQPQKSAPLQREERRVAVVGGGAVGKVWQRQWSNTIHRSIFPDNRKKLTPNVFLTFSPHSPNKNFPPKQSSITVAFVKHEFFEEYDPTIEDSYTNQVRVDDKVCLVHILDTAGQDEYKSLRSQYMKDAEGFILVFDLTNRDSLTNLIEFIEDIVRYRENEKFPCVLVGNKSDLKEEACFSQNLKQEVDEFRRTYLFDCPYIETSALKRVNIDSLFQTIVRLVRKDIVETAATNSFAALSTAHGKSSTTGGGKRKTSLFGSISQAQDEKSDLANIQHLLWS